MRLTRALTTLRCRLCAFSEARALVRQHCERTLIRSGRGRRLDRNEHVIGARLRDAIDGGGHLLQRGLGCIGGT